MSFGFVVTLSGTYIQEAFLEEGKKHMALVVVSITIQNGEDRYEESGGELPATSILTLNKLSGLPTELCFLLTAYAFKFFTDPHCLFNEKVLVSYSFNIQS